jgi:hypothetical protein
MIPKLPSRIALLVAAFSLASLSFGPKALADDISNAVDAFDRDLGLERMGPDIVNVDQQNAASQGSSSGTSAKKKAGQGSSHLPHSVLSQDTLTFQSSQHVTDSVRGFMIAKVTQNNMMAVPAADKRFANDAVLHQFDRKFAPYGFSSHNFGDTVAGYLIATWEILHNSDASQNPEGIRRVREAVRRKMKEKPKITDLSNTDKQRYSEIFKYVTVLVIDQMQELKQKQNAAGERLLQDQVAKPPLKFGLDLRRMQLTDQGFVK